MLHFWKKQVSYKWSPGGPKGRQSEPHTQRNLWITLLMVKMASSIARGRGHMTTTSHNMAAIIGHADLVNSVPLWYWTSILWSIDTCQNKVFADQNHVAGHVAAFRLDRGFKPG